MKRILAGRTMGKTTNLLYQAHYLALKNPDKTILFVTVNNSDYALEKYLRLFGDKIAKNIRFISRHRFIVDRFLDTKKYKVVIDELDEWLKMINVEAYSNTIGEIM